MRLTPTSVVTFALTGALLATCFFLNRLPQVSSDLQSLFPKSSPLYEAYLANTKLFGDFLTDVIVVRVGSELDLETREQVAELEDALLLIDGIESVVSPNIAFSKAVTSPFTLRAEKTSSARFLVKISATLSDAQRTELNNEIKRLMTRFSHLQPSRTGAFFISESVTSVISREAFFRTPITLLVLFVVSALLLHSIRLAFCVLVAPLLAVIWTVAGASLGGYSLGPISQLVPPFCLAVGASYAIHVAIRLSSTPQKLQAQARAELQKAISIASLTSIIGIGSLYLLEIPAVQEFALLGAFGIAASAFFSLSLTPLFFGALEHVTEPLPSLARFKERGIVVGVILLVTLVIGIVGIPRIRVHTEPMMFLPKSSPERIQIDRALKSFPGNRILSLVFTSSKGRLSPEDLRFIHHIAMEAASNESVLDTVDHIDFEDMDSTRSEISLVQRESFETVPTEISNKDLSASRVLLETGLEGAPLLSLQEELSNLVSKELYQRSQFAHLHFSISGLELLIAQQTESIVHGIIQSLLLTLGVVSLMLLYLFRNWRLLLAGLIPNVIPVVVVLGSIGILYADINLGASLVGAAALSIAVDNTFHFLISWTENRKGARDPELTSATLLSKRHCIPSFVTTSIVLISGFSVMAISEVLPVQQFGLLLSVTLFIGLLADTMILPYFTTQLEKTGLESQ